MSTTSPSWSTGLAGAEPAVPAPRQAPTPVVDEQLQRTWAPVKVDLLPESYRVARRVRAAQRGVVAGLAVVVVLVAAVSWQTRVARSHVEAELAAVTARQAALTAQTAELSQVPAVIDELADVQAARAGAFTGDIRWYTYLDGLTTSVPEGVWLTDIAWGPTDDAASGDPATTDVDAAAADAADPATAPVAAVASGSQGTLTVSGSTEQPALVAAWLESAAATDGFADPRYSTLDRTDIEGTAVYHFTATVGITDAALSHRFDTGSATTKSTTTGAGS